MIMISAKSCIDAGELLAERDELSSKVSGIKATKRCRISYQVASKYRGDDEPHFHMIDTGEMDVTAAIRKLLLQGFEEQLEQIDAKLRAMGVEPPDAGESLFD